MVPASPFRADRKRKWGLISGLCSGAATLAIGIPAIPALARDHLWVAFCAKHRFGPCSRSPFECGEEGTGDGFPWHLPPSSSRPKAGKKTACGVIPQAVPRSGCEWLLYLLSQELLAWPSQ